MTDFETNPVGTMAELERLRKGAPANMYLYDPDKKCAGLQDEVEKLRSALAKSCEDGREHLIMCPYSTENAKLQAVAEAAEAARSAKVMTSPYLKRLDEAIAEWRGDAGQCRHDNCSTGGDECDWICDDCGAHIDCGSVVQSEQGSDSGLGPEFDDEGAPF